MPKTIRQTVRLSASPDELFGTYMDSKKHGAAVSSTASISRAAGGKFSVFGGYVQGRNLLIVPKRMIVQSWRGRDWRAGEPGAAGRSSCCTPTFRAGGARRSTPDGGPTTGSPGAPT